MDSQLLSPTAFFYWELDQILNDVIRHLTIRIFTEKVPQYFMQVESSPSGKFHENFDGSHNMLCNHVKSAAREFLTLLTHPYVSEKFTSIQADYCLAAILLHDCMKRGIYQSPLDHNMFESPVLCVYLQPDNLTPLEYQHFTEIVRLIICQKGPWTTSANSTTTLQEPYDDMTRIVHWCDWRASRRNTSISISNDPELLNYISRKR